MAGIQAPALAAGGAHLPRSARASIFHATLFSVKRILAGRGVVWGTIPPPIDRRRRALREAVLLSEEKASDERRRMQRQTELAEIRALERLEAEESIWRRRGL